MLLPGGNLNNLLSLYSSSDQKWLRLLREENLGRSNILSSLCNKVIRLSPARQKDYEARGIPFRYQAVRSVHSRQSSTFQIL